MHLEQLDATFGATVTDIDLKALDPATWEELHAAWLEYALLIFPDQFVDRDVQNGFARRFGELEFEAAPISNLGRDGRVHADAEDDVVKSLRGNEGWHHDSTYMPTQAKGAVFSAEIVPAAGPRPDGRTCGPHTTSWTRHPRLIATSSPITRFLQPGKGRLHAVETNEAADTTIRLPRHGAVAPPAREGAPRDRTAHLLIGRHAYGIVGMDPDESEALLDRLNDWACQPPRVYFHDWAVGDVVVWDNRRLMHRATPFDMTEPRRMWHTRIAGEPDQSSR